MLKTNLLLKTFVETVALFDLFIYLFICSDKKKIFEI